MGKIGGEFRRSGWMESMAIGVSMVALIGVFATGCSKSDGGGGSAQAAPKPRGPEESQTTQEGPQLTGTWESTCRDSNLFGLSENSRLMVQGTHMSKLTRYHTAGNCGASGIEIEAEADFSTGAEVKPNVRQLDMNVTALRVRPVTDAGVQVLKLAKLCDYTEWKVGETKDVTADTGKPNCFPKLPQKLYDVYSIDGTKLFFGKGDDLTDSTKRPKGLDTDFYYNKQ